MNRAFFKKCGRKGGLTRARALTPSRRLAIASQAAKARWGKRVRETPMTSVRLDGIRWDDPVYLGEIVNEGGPKEWSLLHQKVADRPFGAEAVALLKVLSSEEVYGVTPLWKGIVRRLQGT